jgi:TP901 family phage tail tape measure protein
VATSSSSVIIGLQVNLRGGMKLDQLNAALKMLKTNLASLQRGASGAAIRNTMTNMSKAIAQTAQQAKNAASQRIKIEKDVARDIARTDSNMARVFAKLKADQVKAEKKAAAERIKIEQMYAKMFDQIETQTTRSVNKAAADQIRAEAKAAKQRMALVAGKYRNAIAEAKARGVAEEKSAAQATRAWSRYYAVTIKNTDNLVERLRKIETAYDAIFRAGFRIQMIGQQMRQLGQSTIGFLSDMAAKFGEFEFMLNRASGAMGILQDAVDGGRNIYDKFQSAILDTAAELRLFDPSDVAKATYYWASTSGQQVNTLGDLKTAMAAVVPLMKEAALTETSYETAIKGVYSILVQYGKGIDEVQDVTEKLQKVTVETAAEFPDLINSFKMVGPIAAANNVTFEEMVDLFGRLADAGIRGTMSGRAFRQLFIQLVKPSDKAKEALDDLWKTTKAFGGKSYAEMVFPRGSFVGPAKYIDMLAVATKDLTQVQRNALLAQITTANELPVITALVNKQIRTLNTGTNAWAKSSKATRSAAEMFRIQWDQLANSWKGVSTAFTTGVDTIRIQIGGRLAKMFTPVMDQIIVQLGRIRKWIDNPANSEIIDFFLKAAGALGVFLTVAGGAAVAVGSLVALSAAIMVIVRGFGPLFGAVSGAIGVFGGLAAAISRNFEYIQKQVKGALTDINSALGGTAGGVEKITELFNTFTAATGPLFDFIVRGVADAIRAFGALIKVLSGLGPASEAIKVIGGGIFYFFSLKAIANVLGMAKAFGALKVAMLGGMALQPVFNSATGEIEKTMVRQAGALERVRGGVTKVGVAMGAGVGPVGKLSGGLKGLLSGTVGLLGPGGILVLGAAIASFAYSSNFLGIKDGLDAITKSMSNMSGEAREAIDSLGNWHDAVIANMSTTSEYTRLQKELASVQKEYASQDWFTLGGLFDKNDPAMRLRDAERSFNEFQTKYIANFDAITKAAVEAGNEVSRSDVFAMAVKFKESLGYKDISLSTQALYAYYNAMGKVTTEGGDAIYELTKAWKDARVIFSGSGKKVTLDEWLNITLGPEGRIKARAKDQASQLLKIYQESLSGSVRSLGMSSVGKDFSSRVLTDLVNLRDTGNLPDELAKKIDDLLSEAGGRVNLVDDLDGLGAGIEGAVTNEVKKVDLATAVTSAAEGFKNFDKRVAELIKNYIKPGSQIHGVINSIMTGAISKLGPKTDPTLTTTIASWITDYQTQFDNQFQLAGGVGSKAGRQFARNQIKSLTTWMKAGIPASTPQVVKQALFDTMVKMYEAANIPVPATLYTQIFGKGKKVPEKYASGIESKTGPRGPVTAAAAKAARDTRALNTFVPNAFNWGRHLIENFVKGMNSYYVPLTTSVNRVTNYLTRIKFSEPKWGPLKGFNKSGGHMMQSLIRGIESERGNLLRTVDGVARDIASVADSNYGLGGASLESNASKLIKVQVDVRSGDGSVDQLTTSQLQNGIMNSQFLRELEHAATVD